MLYGDVPVFANVLDASQRDEVFRAWLDMRVELEELTIRGALVTAHLNVRLNDDKRSPTTYLRTIRMRTIWIDGGDPWLGRRSNSCCVSPCVATIAP